jgi:succinate dehydrogenase / fumarate reductase cytochrome b subunit
MPNRPKYLNLLQIRLPLPGLISIMHRVSGAGLFLALPLLLWWLQQSLTSADSFTALEAVFSHWFAKLVVIALVWGYLHHLCAGLRHLALDLDIGTGLGAARLSSMLVLGISMTLTVVVAALLW